MSEYPSNSKSDRPTLKPVGRASLRKENLGKKIVRAIFSGGTDRSIAGNLAFEVIAPAIKDLLRDVVTSGIDRLLYGDVRQTPSSVRRSGYTDYSRSSNTKTVSRLPETNNRIKSAADIIFATRDEANQALENLILTAEQYGFVTVADLCTLGGVSSDFPDRTWGWEFPALAESSVRRVSNGYILQLEPAKAV